MPDLDMPLPLADLDCAGRTGMAKLAKFAFDGGDLRPLWQSLLARLQDGTAVAGEGLDLALIAQLLGEKQAGLAIQREVLRSHQLYRLPCASDRPRMRVLALAADTDMGSNMPIEFLLETSDIDLVMLYVLPETGLPDPLPEHDVAIVIASDSDDCQDLLDKVDAAAARWPRPLLNAPRHIRNLDRDKLHRLLTGIEGLEIPETIPATREALVPVALGSASLDTVAERLAFPIIIRPRGSHAGFGLARIDHAVALATYLDERPEAEFFVARFVDYSSEDGEFRKYRIVFVDGEPYACHMAIANRWDIWYLNAGMSASAAKRLEEETFMRTFDFGFGRRHRTALAELARRIALDYFTIDCAETKCGDLLIFEADNTAVVHDMDSPDLFPYKHPQMQKVFDAFIAMLDRRAGRARAQVA